MIIEKISEKGIGKMNEDSIVINNKNKIYGVFDGATSLIKDKNNGLTGGFIASNLLKNIFEKTYIANVDLLYLFEKGNKLLKNEMINLGININNPLNLFSTTGAVVQIRNRTLKYSKVGDSNILIIYKNGDHKILGKNIDHDKYTLEILKKIKKEGKDPLLNKLFENKKIETRKNANIKYGVINGFLNNNFVDYGSIGNLKELKDIIIFSDGIYPIKKTNCYNDIVNIYNLEGIIGVKNYIRNFEKNDNSCTKIPRFKIHDDLSIVGIKLN